MSKRKGPLFSYLPNTVLFSSSISFSHVCCWRIGLVGSVWLPPSWEIMHWLWCSLLNPCWGWAVFWDATQVSSSDTSLKVAMGSFSLAGGGTIFEGGPAETFCSGSSSRQLCPTALAWSSAGSEKQRHWWVICLLGSPILISASVFLYEFWQSVSNFYL